MTTLMIDVILSDQRERRISEGLLNVEILRRNATHLCPWHWHGQDDTKEVKAICLSQLNSKIS